MFLEPEEEATLQRSALDYDPSPFFGDVAIFRPAHRPRIMGQLSGWEELVHGDLEIHEVPGNHLTVFRPPDVRILAELVNASLIRAQKLA